MAVHVRQTHAPTGQSIVKHNDADSFSVEAGHLVVTKRDGGGFSSQVAVYAPGEWRNAVVRDD